MVLIRNNVQKESTYGWYPSKVNIYENPRAKHGYDKECLFRHWQSGLHHTNPDGVAPVTPPGFRGSMKSNPRSRTSSKTPSSRAMNPQVPALMISGSRSPFQQQNHGDGPPPQFVFERSRQSSRKANIPTPHMDRGYHGWQPQPTIIGVVDPNGPFIAQSPKLDVAMDDSYQIPTPKPDERLEEATAAISKQLTNRAPTPAQQISGSFRAQSASLNRPRATPTRPIKSAGSRSQATASVSLGLAANTMSNTSNNKLDTNRSKPASRSYWNQVKHEIQAPDDDEDGMPERPPTPVNLRTPTPTEAEEATYESQIDKYGWLAEVHGDPLNLKLLTERLPYTVKCEEPVVGEYPYKTRVTLGDTFFLNTIPRKPMTFTVHPEWQSENFVAKRKELQKQGRIFHARNFGFAY